MTGAPNGADSERPLNSGQKALLMTSAALALVLFALFALATVLGLIVLLAVELVVVAATARFGLIRLILPVLTRHTGLLKLVLRSFWIRKGAEFRVPLTQAEAPGLFALLASLSARMAVPQPRQVVLEMNAGAWVHLQGFRRAAHKTTLGLGYDLLALLSEQEIEAVIAHEMAHAKLVRRGFKRLLGAGTNRAVRLTGELAALVNAYRRSAQRFELAEILLRGADPCARLIARLVATYSRQDEFEADWGAAQVCGSAPLRSSLLKLEKAAPKLARISWNERVAQLQGGAGFSSWLAGELGGEIPAPEADAPAALLNRYSTHPSTRDRLSALPADPAQPAPWAPAIRLFADPDALAVRLVCEIQRVTAEQEQQDSRERRRWLKRFRGGLVLRFWRSRHPFVLPVPPFALLQASREDQEPIATVAEREKLLEAELRGRVASIPAPKARRTVLIEEARSALGRCEYLRAHVGARLSLSLGTKSTEALLILLVAGASFRNAQRTADLLRAVRRATGLRTPASLWSAGWGLFLLGDWAAAESFLAEALRRTPDQPTFCALLSVCQAQRGKNKSALAHARLAWAVGPKDAPARKLLVNQLIGSGQLGEARACLDEAGAAGVDDADLAVLAIRLHLLQHNFGAADRDLDGLRRRAMPAHQWIVLGAAFERARRDQVAAALYASALEAGHFPEARLGLARLAFHAGRRQEARQQLLGALDASRPPGQRSRGALDVFAPVLRELLLLQDPVQSARAWVATVTGSTAAGPLANQNFLLFAAGRSDAEAHLQAVMDAVQPDKPPLPAGSVAWTEAPRDQQPVGPVRPGIQRFWRR